MKKKALFIITMLFSVGAVAQNTIPISQPYDFLKWVIVNDSVTSPLYRQGTDSLATNRFVRSKIDTVYISNDTLYFRKNFTLYGAVIPGLANAYINSSFDTSTRILKLYSFNGDSTSLIIPGGSGGATGVTVLSSSKIGNLVTVSGNNGTYTIFSIADADSTLYQGKMDSSRVLTLLGTYLPIGDTGSMLSPYARSYAYIPWSDTVYNIASQMLARKVADSAAAAAIVGLPYFPIADTSAAFNGYVRKVDSFPGGFYPWSNPIGFFVWSDTGRAAHQLISAIAATNIADSAAAAITPASIGANLQGVTQVSSLTTIPSSFKAGLKVGDSTIYRNAYFEGSSLTLQVGEGWIWSYTQTWPTLISNQFGYIPNNLGVGGRALQQVTVGDNSLYSNISNIPAYTPNELVVVEGQVNDVKGDTTKYNVSAHTTQLTAYLNAIISSGAAPSSIIFFQPDYYNPVGGTNQGNIAYRHAIYSAAESSVCASLGVHFYDAYFDFQTLYWNNNTILNGDSVHMTISGAREADSLLAAKMVSWGFSIFNYATVKSSIYGDHYVLGSLTASDSLTTTNVNTQDISTTGKARVWDFTVGANLSYGGVTANTSKFGGISAYTYGDSLNQGIRWQPLSFYSTSSANTLNIGGYISPGSMYPGKSATAINFYINPTSTSYANATQVAEYYPSGHAQLGAVSNSYNDNNGAVFTEQLVEPSVTTNNASAMYLNWRPTVTADGLTIITGPRVVPSVTMNGAVSGSSLTGGSGYANGTYTNVPLTGGTGTGAVATIVVSGGAVTSVTMTTSGNGYLTTDALSASPSFDGVGAGSGFSLTTLTLGKLNTTLVSGSFATYPVLFTTSNYTGTIGNGEVWYDGTNFNLETGSAKTRLNIVNTSGVVAIAAGGTNNSAAGSAGEVVYSNGTQHAYTAVGSSTQLLQSNGSSAPSWVSPSSLGFAPTSGSANYIQNYSTGGAQSANFDISGYGEVGTTFDVLGTFQAHSAAYFSGLTTSVSPNLRFLMEDTSTGPVGEMYKSYSVDSLFANAPYQNDTLFHVGPGGIWTTYVPSYISGSIVSKNDSAGSGISISTAADSTIVFSSTDTWQNVLARNATATTMPIVNITGGGNAMDFVATDNLGTSIKVLNTGYGSVQMGVWNALPSTGSWIKPSDGYVGYTTDAMCILSADSIKFGRPDVSTASGLFGAFDPQGNFNLNQGFKLPGYASGTAGTDSVLVWHSDGSVRKISATYYGTGGGGGGVSSVSAGLGMSFSTITSTGPVAADTTKLAYKTANINFTGNNQHSGTETYWAANTWNAPSYFKGGIWNWGMSASSTITDSALVSDSGLVKTVPAQYINMSGATTGMVPVWNSTNGYFSLATPSGSGTVTSVGLSLPSFITVSGSPVTGSGTLTGTLATQTANTVFAGPTTGSAAAPTFRALVAGDIPSLSYAPTAGSSSITTLGTISTGTWDGTLISPTYGGTGVNNGSKTITLGGNLTTAGAYTTTLTSTANTSVTLPTSGTLVNSAVTSLSSLTTAAGGAFGTNAYTSTAYAPLASPTFTGTVTFPTPWTLGSTSVTSTGAQLNYLNAATGTTGTMSTNLVFSASPTFTGTVTAPTLEVSHLAGNSSAPTVATTGGTGGSVSVSGTDAAGTITITTGSAAFSTVTLTFNSAYASAPHVMVCPGDGNVITWGVNNSTETTTSFSLQWSSLSGSTTYHVNYMVIQ